MPSRRLQHIIPSAATSDGAGVSLRRSLRSEVIKRLSPVSPSPMLRLRNLFRSPFRSRRPSLPKSRTRRGKTSGRRLSSPSASAVLGRSS